MPTHLPPPPQTSHIHTHTHTHLYTRPRTPVEATIGFEQTEYVVVESGMFSNVTIRLTGTITMDTVVRVTTADDSAVCELIFKLL